MHNCKNLGIWLVTGLHYTRLWCCDSPYWTVWEYHD